MSPIPKQFMVMFVLLKRNKRILIIDTQISCVKEFKQTLLKFSRDKKKNNEKNCGRIEIATDPECVKSLNDVFDIYTK